MPAEIANDGELRAEQVHAERGARGFAVLHREQAATEPTPPDPHDEEGDEREHDGDEHHLRAAVVERLPEEVQRVDARPIRS